MRKDQIQTFQLNIYVEDIDASILAVHANEGEILTNVKSSGGTSK